MSNNAELPDLQAGLNSLGQTTTAADLVREKGQTRKVRVISERKLREWMETLIKQITAGRADAFSDQEKQRMLERTQDELAKRIQREQAAEVERDRLKAELDHAMEVVASVRAQSQQGVDTSAAIEAAMSDLRAKLEERDRINAALQDENYDIQDQLGEKIELISATISEKDTLRRDLERLRDTLKNQMVHSNDLVAGVMNLDEACYAGQHQNDEPQGEGDAAFYRDFAVGSKVIATLANDIANLRSLARQADEDRAANALLADDLALIAEVRAGKAAVSDVAEPVGSLVEALIGARSSAQKVESALIAATGASSHVTLPEAPDADDVPVKALADATALVRSLDAQLIQAQRRITALAQMAADADAARNEREEELERLRAAFGRVAHGIATAHAAAALSMGQDAVGVDAATADQPEDVAQLADANADLSARAEAGTALIAQLTRRLEDHAEAASQATAAATKATADLAAAQVATARAQAIVAAAENKVTAAESQTAVVQSQITAAQVNLTALKAKTEAELASERRMAAAAAEQAQTLSAQLREIEGSAEIERQRFEAESEAVRAQLAQRDDELSAIKIQTQAVQAEHQEHTQGAREVIAQLTQARDAKDRELRRVMAEAQLASTRAAAAESTNRTLAETLTKLANQSEQRPAALGEIEKAMTQLPAEGEVGIVVKPTTSVDLADSGRRLGDELMRRQNEQASERQRQAAELIAARNQIASRDQELSALQRAHERTVVRAAEADALTQRLAEAEERLRKFDHATGIFRAQKQEEADRTVQAKAEAERLKADLARVRAELTAVQSQAHTAQAAAAAAVQTVRAVIDRDRTLAGVAGDLIAADGSIQVESLAPAVTALAARSDELRAQAASAATAASTAEQALAAAQQHIAEITAEQAENAESAREIIAQLSHVRDGKDRDLRDVRHQVEASQARASSAEARAAAAEDASRVLAESLAQVAAAEEQRPHAAVDMEGALAQLPVEGESGFALTPAVTAALADSGRRLAIELVQRRNEAGARVSATALAAAQAEAERLVQLNHEHEVAQRRLKAEKEALSRAVAEQSQAANAVRAELAQTTGALRAEVAALTVEREENSDRVRSAEGKALAATRAAEIAQQQALAQAERTRTGIAEVLRLMPAAAGDAGLAALDRAQAAAANGDHVAAGDLLAQALRARVEDFSAAAERHRQELVKTQAQAQGQQADLAGLRAVVSDRDLRLETLASETKRLAQAAAAEAARATAVTAQLAQRERELATKHSELDKAEDELADFRARREAKTGFHGEEVERLRMGLNEAKGLIQEFAAERMQHKQEQTAAEARLKRLREEFENRMMERDRKIQELDRQLDQRGDAGAEVTGLRAQISDLETRLNQTTQRLSEMEGMAHGTAGLAGRSGDLVRELKRVQDERDRLRADLRRHEAELADARALADELTSRVEEKRREAVSAMEQATTQVQAQLADLDAAREEARRMREENAGIKARLRRSERGGSGISG